MQQLHGELDAQRELIASSEKDVAELNKQLHQYESEIKERVRIHSLSIYLSLSLS